MISLIPLVVLIPLGSAALALALPGRRRAQQLITVIALVAVVALSGAFMWIVDQQGALVMQVGGWAAPFGISLVVDRLSALMLTVSAVVLLGVLLFSLGQGLADGDDETPVSIYYPTYLVLGAGVCNAFIAGDLFNLYVGFEILLVASYVLITLGGTGPRIRAGVTYVVVSLVSSILFLVSIGLVYAATGTVNIAQLTLRIAELPGNVQLLLNLALLIAFGIKAAIFPLAFWLPDSYPTAPAPVTAVFAGLLTKVGVYAIIRAQTQIFPHSSVDQLLLVIAALTLLVGILGAVSQLDIKRLLSVTLISQFAMHRSPRWWDSSLTFRPQRWINADGHFSEDAPGQPRGAWFPFGWGNRRCIGEQFAWTEATLVLATLAQRWRPELVPGSDITLIPAVTLRSRDGMPMVLKRR